MIVITTFLDKPTRYHTCNTHEEAEDIIFSLYEDVPMYSMIFKNAEELEENITYLDSAYNTLRSEHQYSRLPNKFLFSFNSESNIKKNVLKRIEGDKVSKRAEERIQKLKEAERLIKEKERFIETHKNPVSIRPREDCEELSHYYDWYECDICGHRTFCESEIYAVMSDEFDHHKDMCIYCATEYGRKHGIVLE